MNNFSKYNKIFQIILIFLVYKTVHFLKIIWQKLLYLYLERYEYFKHEITNDTSFILKYLLLTIENSISSQVDYYLKHSSKIPVYSQV